MKLPFVSREHYEYMRQRLEADVERERSNFKRSLDYILEKAAGSRMFDEVVQRPANNPTSGYMDAEHVVRETPAHKSARERIRLLQEQVNAEQDEAAALIAQTIDEGKKAATQ